jgi:hypothetical protein
LLDAADTTADCVSIISKRSHLALAEPLILHQAAAVAAQIYKVELDDRCFLFPDGKLMSHVLISREGSQDIVFDAAFPFNNTRRASRFLSLNRHEARLFARELVDAVYAAKAGIVLEGSLKIAIIVAPNGYRIEGFRADSQIEIFLSTGVIWRFIKALLMAVDDASPVVSN